MASLRKIYFLLIYLFQYPVNVFRGNRIPFSNKISGNVFLSGCKFGKYNFIGKNSVLRLTEIGHYCSIASGVQIGGMEHPYWLGSTSPLLFDSKEISHKKTTIGNDVWIGANVVVRRGINIGDGAVIGSSSLVLKDVPAYSIVVGIPAKVIKTRFDHKLIEQVQKTQFWLLAPGKAKKVLSKIDFRNNLDNN